MDSVTGILERKEFWALAGTALGFLLNETSRVVRDVLKRRRLRVALRDELEINLYQLSHKMNTIGSVIEALQHARILPGTSVPFANSVYTTNLASIIHLLKPLERDLVHNIYARLSIQDNFLAHFEDKFMEALKDGVTDNPWKAFTTKLTELREDCEITQEMIGKFLANKPLDIYGRKLGKPARPAEFAGKVTPEVVRGSGKLSSITAAAVSRKIDVRVAKQRTRNQRQTATRGLISVNRRSSVGHGGLSDRCASSFYSSRFGSPSGHNG